MTPLGFPSFPGADALQLQRRGAQRRGTLRALRLGPRGAARGAGGAAEPPGGGGATQPIAPKSWEKSEVRKKFHPFPDDKSNVVKTT